MAILRAVPFAISTGASFVAVATAPAQHGWTIELSGGSAYHFPTPLRLEQAGERDIALTARYATQPWTDAPYYALRVARWVAGRAWEVELIHHKLYLRNPPPDVQQFEVSHGYNLLLLSRAIGRRGMVWRAGAGPVVAYPEATVRQKTLSGRGGLLGGGYHVAGVAAQVAGARRLAIARHLYVVVEAKLTAAYARVPIPDGRATVPNAALHGLLGVGYAF